MSHAAPVRAANRARKTNISTAGVAVLVAGLAGGSPLWHDLGWMVAVGVLQGALVWAWMMGTAVPGKWGGVLLGLAAGGAADALLLADRHDGLSPLLAVFGLLFPAGWVSAPGQAHLLSVARFPLTRIVLLGLCVLALFHWAHRFRYTLYEGLQLKHLSTLIIFGCYGGALAGSVIAGYLLLPGL